MTRPNTSSIDSPTRWLSALVRRAWLIFIGTAVGVGMAWLLVTEAPIVYSSTTKLIVQETRGAVGISSSDISLSSKLAATYEALITTRPVVEEVATRLGLNASNLSRMIKVNAVGNTRILAITATDPEPQQSADIANEVAIVFIEQTRDARLAEIAAFQQAALSQGITDFSAVLTAEMVGLNSIQVVEEAVLDGPSGGGGILREVILAGSVGFAIAAGLSILLEVIFDIVRSKETFEGLFEYSVLAVLPKANVMEPVVSRASTDAAFGEGVRFLRTNLQLMPADASIKTLLVTSSEANSGKTTISTYLSIAIAEAGKSIVVIDGDLRKPMISSALLSSKPAAGVSTFLSDKKQNIDDILVAGPINGLSVIPSGPIPPNPSDLLNTPRFNFLLNEASKIADFIIVDAPPTLAVADTQIMAGYVDGVLVVVDTGRTRARLLRAVFQSLEQIDAKIIGVVLNKYRPSRLNYGYGGYGTYYGYGYGDAYGQTSRKDDSRGIRRFFANLGLPGFRN